MFDLKADIDNALSEDDTYNWSEWGTPKLKDLKTHKPAVMSRYAGTTIVAGRMRHIVQVYMITSQSLDKSAYIGLQGQVDDLLSLLELVNNAYPRLLGTQVDHKYSFTGSRTGTTYIAVVVNVLGG